MKWCSVRLFLPGFGFLNFHPVMEQFVRDFRWTVCLSKLETVKSISKECKDNTSASGKSWGSPRVTMLMKCMLYWQESLAKHTWAGRPTTLTHTSGSRKVFFIALPCWLCHCSPRHSPKATSGTGRQRPSDLCILLAVPLKSPCCEKLLTPVLHLLSS